MDQILLPFLTYLSVTEKLVIVKRLFRQLGTQFRVELFQQESMYGLSAGTKKVVVVERWRLVEVRL